MSDRFIMSARQAAELDLALERNGWLPADVKTLSQGDTLARFLTVLKGHASIVLPEHVIDLDADPYLPRDWEVQSHVRQGKFTWDSSKITYKRSSAQWKKSDTGDGMLRDFAEKGFVMANANLLDYLYENPHLIPTDSEVKWKNTPMLFLGTIYLNKDAVPSFRYLKWDWGSSKWFRCWSILNNSWDAGAFSVALEM